MIRYALSCDDGHRFESWFYDSAAFDEQAKRGLVSCPVCESPKVVKAIMAPAVVVARGGLAPRAPDDATLGERPPPPVEPASDVALIDKSGRAAARVLRDKIMAETRDVGRRFAEEARRIHDAETPLDRIRGQATLAEARDLLDDGIMVLPLPAFPDDLN